MGFLSRGESENDFFTKEILLTEKHECEKKRMEKMTQSLSLQKDLKPLIWKKKSYDRKVCKKSESKKYFLTPITSHHNEKSLKIGIFSC